MDLAKQSKTATSPGKEEAEAPHGGYRKGPWTEQEDLKLVGTVLLLLDDVQV
jgi:hypothetical protein